MLRNTKSIGSSVVSNRVQGVRGDIIEKKDLPGDKSISHRALILSAIATGKTVLTGLNNGEDVEQTRSALEAMGIRITPLNSTQIEVEGGAHFFHQPKMPIYLGNSGTSARLLCGLVATQDIQVTFYGDSSLSHRPMQRVMTPLSRMGALFSQETQNSLPLTIKGTPYARPLTYTMPIPSAQVKTSLLIAALFAQGTTHITEPVLTRDHTERLLTYLEYPITIDMTTTHDGQHARVMHLEGGRPLVAKPVDIPADASAAAFLAVAALITPSSCIKLSGVGWNPFRNTIFRVLQSMGGRIEVSNIREECGELRADMQIYSSILKAVTIPAEASPPLIDEYPVLAMAAAVAQGVSVFHGLSELRYKESDRLSAITEGLKACGVEASIHGDSLRIQGSSSVFGGASIDAHKDHRIAAAFYILGMVTKNPILIYGAQTIRTSFPHFFTLIHQLHSS